MLMFSHPCGYYYPYPALSRLFNKTAAKDQHFNTSLSAITV